MFSNFLYFLIALVIFATSDLFEFSGDADTTGIYYSMAALAVFALVCRLAFARLDRRGKRISYAGMDHQVNQTIARLSVGALGLFAANIYLFRLNQIAKDFPLFKWLPTLEALVFLGLFLFYLVLIWNGAYKIQKRHFPGSLTKKSFVFSNIAFSLPALLPWFCLSLFADLIEFLPFEGVKDFFHSTEGEIAYILVFLLAVAVFGPVLIRRLWGCTPLSQGRARAGIERVCQRAGLKYNDILLWELFGGTMITAGVMGIVGRFRYILVTPALLNSLDEDEIEGVMLHEIGHVQRHHMLFYLFFFLGFIACNFVFFEPAFLLLYVAEPVFALFEGIGISKAVAHPAMICLCLILFFTAYFRLGFGFFMRQFERQADLHIFTGHASPSALVSTFYKIASLSRQSIDTPNWHHHSIGERIRFLEACKENPALIRQHHRRVRNLMAGYAVLVLALVTFGYSLGYGRLNEPFNRYVTGKILNQQLAVDPENSDLYVLVGDYYYGAKQYEKARDAYENVISIDPANVHALNNLAWLYATCPETGLLDAARAVDLASRALEIREEAFILDTYAEALVMNQRFEAALAAARQALELARDKKAYYRSQVERFSRLAEGV